MAWWFWSSSRCEFDFNGHLFLIVCVIDISMLLSIVTMRNPKSFCTWHEVMCAKWSLISFNLFEKLAMTVFGCANHLTWISGGAPFIKNKKQRAFATYSNLPPIICTWFYYIYYMCISIMNLYSWKNMPKCPLVTLWSQCITNGISMKSGKKGVGHVQVGRTKESYTNSRI
jgi:hypothetical protein